MVSGTASYPSLVTDFAEGKLKCRNSSDACWVANSLHNCALLDFQHVSNPGPVSWQRIRFQKSMYQLRFRLLVFESIVYRQRSYLVADVYLDLLCLPTNTVSPVPCLSDKKGWQYGNVLSLWAARIEVKDTVGYESRPADRLGVTQDSCPIQVQWQGDDCSPEVKTHTHTHTYLFLKWLLRIFWALTIYTINRSFITLLLQSWWCILRSSKTIARYNTIVYQTIRRFQAISYYPSIVSNGYHIVIYSPCIPSYHRSTLLFKNDYRDRKNVAHKDIHQHQLQSSLYHDIIHHEYYHGCILAWLHWLHNNNDDNNNQTYRRYTNTISLFCNWLAQQLSLRHMTRHMTTMDKYSIDI